MKGLKFHVDTPSVVLGGVLGLVGGSVLGFVLAKRALSTSYNARLDEEIESVKEHYQNKPAKHTSWSAIVQDTLSRPVFAVPAREDSDGAREGESADREDAGEGVPLISREDVAPPLRRDTSKPYGISEAELGEPPNPGWQQITITWYVADNVLADDKDDPIPNILQTVGLLNEAGFGAFGGDPNIRYVRNHRLEVDFEIVLDRRSFTDVVLGYGQPNKQRATKTADHQ